MAVLVAHLLSSLVSIMIMLATASIDDDDKVALLSFKAEASYHGSGTLASWNGNTSFCSWKGVTCSRGRSPPRVLELSLSSCGLVGTLSPAIGNLTLLQRLNLSSNSIYGVIPPSIGRLRRLEKLDLSDNSFSGTLPANLSACINMKNLRLRGNQLDGRIPAVLGDTLTRLEVLSLSKNRFTGAIPASLANLSSLVFISIWGNQLEGTIPPSIGRLRRLEKLDLSKNLFSGTLPANLSSCTRMDTIMVSENQLDGRIPAALGDTLTRLNTLSLTSNKFSGTIPASMANLSSLVYLSIWNNQLEGTIPSGLGNIAGLQKLVLGLNNLSGELPLSLYNLSSLRIIHVGTNRLHGSIPVDIGYKIPSIQDLILSNNQFSGTIPSSIVNVSTLVGLEIYGNKFTGFVPPTLGRLRALTALTLSGNRLKADKKEGWEFLTSLANCTKLQELDLGGNSFGGPLPGSIVNLSRSLQELYLLDSSISGSIPSGIGNLVNLQLMEIGNNYITGVIPDSIGKLENLGDLRLYNNGLSGLIPSSIGNLTQLNRLQAYYNDLEGPIPASLGKLKNMFYLDLSNNYRLNGSIPKEILELPALSYYLDLSYNSLFGPLPSELGSLANLNQLILSGNQLSGPIPDSIGNCKVLESLLLDDNSFEASIPLSLKNIKGLRVLNLTMNNLSGRIPDALGSIENLQELYLAHNNLSGPIPTFLQNLTLLQRLDVSFNDLQGEVPREGVFRNLTYLSIAGNKKLCSGTPQLHLPTCSTPALSKNRKAWSKSLTVSLGTTGAILFSLLIFILITFLYRKFKEAPKDQLSPSAIEEQYQKVSYHELSRGTNGFSEANLLGKGSYGAVYKCTLDEEGTTRAVKVFNLQQSGSSKSFEAECEALRSVRHRCLVKIITCCSSIDLQGQEFKALVFEFMPNGSLDDWLHPRSGHPTLSNALNLAQRLDIAVDIMDALDYLHNHCQPSIIHCDLKPSNILLAQDMSARVGDFGISRVLLESTNNTLLTSNSSIGIRGSIGYVAPEYAEGCAVSTTGDVYSLGILLLEMFTGRSPTDGKFRDSLDLHKFAEAALPDRTMEIADPTILMHEEGNNKDVANTSITRSRIEECLVSVIGLAVSCSKQQPRERISVRDAAVEMHAIRDAYVMFGV